MHYLKVTLSLTFGLNSVHCELNRIIISQLTGSPPRPSLPRSPFAPGLPGLPSGPGSPGRPNAPLSPCKNVCEHMGRWVDVAYGKAGLSW